MSDNCCRCGHFVRYETADSGTLFGCANPASPEPHDPVWFCADCAVIEQAEEEYDLRILMQRGVERTARDWWQMPSWYSRAVMVAGWRVDGYDLRWSAG